MWTIPHLISFHEEIGQQKFLVIQQIWVFTYWTGQIRKPKAILPSPPTIQRMERTEARLLVLPPIMIKEFRTNNRQWISIHILSLAIFIVFTMVRAIASMLLGGRKVTVMMLTESLLRKMNYQSIFFGRKTSLQEQFWCSTPSIGSLISVGSWGLLMMVMVNSKLRNILDGHGQ